MQYKSVHAKHNPFRQIIKHRHAMSLVQRDRIQYLICNSQRSIVSQQRFLQKHIVESANMNVMITFIYITILKL